MCVYMILSTIENVQASKNKRECISQPRESTCRRYMVRPLELAYPVDDSDDLYD